MITANYTDMELLINSSEELRQLTGNYYANNDFSKVVGDIEQATEELTELVGEKVMEQATIGTTAASLRFRPTVPTNCHGSGSSTVTTPCIWRNTTGRWTHSFAT